ncbi:caspase family protein [Paraburkholderia azotifigens]|uniref:Caspase family protein n=1 Tax=Paraburkholderia azotifigens TaxID=2057004 RepID=A0A5C6V5A8_9BURK|nr:caspase family protein [Paraburkholderia azotifigens]TXC79656.1 caspase family protein [Paraburkholderia azotifigens]
MKTYVQRALILAGAVLLSACAASSLPGYQNTYHSYSVPQTLVERIKVKFREHGLSQASVVRDSTGRIQLVGGYQNEDDVDTAFTIVQSIVGIKSTSPLYPQNIKQKRWEAAAGEALKSSARDAGTRSSVSVKRALVVGLNRFADRYIPQIQGRDDAIVVQDYLKRAGYSVTTLLDEHATQANIESALTALDRSVGPNDDVFIYISSHGTEPVPTPGGADQRKMSIIAYDSVNEKTMTMSDQTEAKLYMQRHSVPDSLVQGIARRPSHTTRVVIDTCYSGDMLDDVKDESTEYIIKTNGGKPEKEGISMAAWSTSDFTSKGIRFADDSGKALAAGQNKAARPIDRNRNGYMIVTATSPNQRSWGPSAGHTFPSPTGGQPLNGSFFTQSLFAYLKSGNGKFGPAFRDAQNFTSRMALDASHGKEDQNPRQFSTIPDDLNAIY